MPKAKVKSVRRRDTAQDEDTEGDTPSSDDEDAHQLQVQLDEMMALYDTMQKYHITSISHLEVKISQLREEIKKLS